MDISDAKEEGAAGVQEARFMSSLLETGAGVGVWEISKATSM